MKSQVWQETKYKKKSLVIRSFPILSINSSLLSVDIVFSHAP